MPTKQSRKTKRRKDRQRLACADKRQASRHSSGLQGFHDAMLVPALSVAASGVVFAALTRNRSIGR